MALTFKNIFQKKKTDDMISINEQKIIEEAQNRNFFRIDLVNLLEGDMQIVEINGERVNLNHIAVLIDNIGPGGLSFICNIKCPVKNSIVLKFRTELLGKSIDICGTPVWVREVPGELYKYGFEFTVDENTRTSLINILNQLQLKMRKKMGFNEGKFISGNNPTVYFKKVLGN